MAPPGPPLKRNRKTQKSQLSLSHSLEKIDHKRAYNATLPIVKLHPEILSEIFTVIAGNGKFEFSPYGLPYQWVRYTQVCHYWREVALSSPRVWSYVRYTNNLDRMRMMLSRSKQAPLHFDFEYKLPSPAILDLVYDEIHRARTLRLEWGTPYGGRYTERPPQLPWLTELSLSPPINRVGPNLLHKDYGLLNTWSMPNLSRLSIHGFCVTWNHTAFKPAARSLTNLTVYRSKSISVGKPVVFEDLLEVFRCAPLLEELSLSNMLGPDMLESQTTDVVPLPRLRSLNLTDNLLSCARVLSRISFPRTFPIRVVGHEVDGHSATAFGEAIASKVGTRDDAEAGDHFEIRSLAIKRISSETCIQAFSEELDIGALEEFSIHGEFLKRPGPKPCFKIILCAHHPVVSGYELCAPLPLRALRVLYLGSDMAFPPVPLLRVMAQGMSAVQTLGIGSGDWYKRSPKTVPEILSVDYAKPLKEIIFPKLAALELFGYEISLDTGNNKTMLELHRALAQRADAGAKVEKVHLHRSVDLLKRDADKLEEVVGKVVWNP